MDPSSHPTNQQFTGLQVPWPWLTAGLATIALTALGTLSVVVSIQSVDVLSTIALALAVLAFAAQLIISLAQGMAGAQQVAQVERVNADTQSALSALRATSDALLATQKEHFGQVLRAALAKAVPDAVEETLSEEAGDNQSISTDSQNLQLQEAILARVEEVMRRQRSEMLPDPPRVSAGRPRAPHPAFEKLDTYPDEASGKQSAELFKTLTPWEAQKLADIARHARNMARIGQEPGAWLKEGPKDAMSSTGISGLASKGLIDVQKRKHPQTRSIRDWLGLTDVGVEVARLLVASGNSPAWLQNSMLPTEGGAR